MTLKYRVYGNGGAGGPVDYGTPLAEVAALAWTSPPLATGSDWAFAVRAFDDVTGLEERNVDARVRLRTGAAGEALEGRPRAPAGVSARQAAGGTLYVAWQHFLGERSVAPQGFRVYVYPAGGAVGTPAAVVPYRASASNWTPGHRPAYSTTVSGLALGVPLSVLVRSYGTAGESTNTAAVPVTLSGAAATAPADAGSAVGFLGSGEIGI